MGVRRPPFVRGSVHPISVLGLTKNEVDASSMSHRTYLEEFFKLHHLKDKRFFRLEA